MPAREFDRFAKSYAKHNSLQKEIARELISLVDDEISRVADIGCGDGAVYDELLSQEKRFEKFYAIDSSKNMLSLHPKDESVELVCLDFNSPEFGERLSELNVDTIISSSALQWAKSPEKVLEDISLNSKKAYLSIFTSETFAFLHKFAGVKSPIHSKERLSRAIGSFFEVENIYILRYRIRFESREDIFRYIKRSGVSGRRGELSFQATKRLIREFPRDYLTFEVLFVVANSKNSLSKS